MRLRSCLILLAALLMAAACSSPADEPLPALLKQLGFSQATAQHDGELLYRKPLEGASLWVSLPQGLGQAPGPVMMIKASGPKGALSAATDAALTTRPEVGQLVEAASRGAYPPKALAEVLKLAQEAAAQPPPQRGPDDQPQVGLLAPGAPHPGPFAPGPAGAAQGLHGGSRAWQMMLKLAA